MKIIGIDQSLTGTGIVILQDSKLLYHTVIKSSKVDGTVYQRVHNIVTQVVDIVKEHNPNIGVIEGVALAAKGMVADLGGVQHVIINHLQYGHNIDMTVVPPKSLKKVCAGNGNANKWMMFDSLPDDVQQVFQDGYKFSKREGKTISGNGFDVTDAYHLACYPELVQTLPS